MGGELRVDGKCCCYMKNPQVDQMKVLGKPTSKCPQGWWTQESGTQENRNSGSEGQPVGRPYLQLQWTPA